MAHEEVFSRQHSAVSEKEALSDQHSAISQNQGQHQKRQQRPFTAENAEDAEESKNLPLGKGKPGQANADEQERVAQRMQALAHKLAQTYEELTRPLERNPGMKREITEGATKEDKVYQKLKQRLKLADMAPRCQWVRQDGTSCGSPQMKRHIYCFAHMQMAEARDLMLRLPPPEDPNAIQVGLMRIQKAVIEDRISMKKAGLLLYSMQLALTNVGQTTFGQAKDEEMVRETVDEEVVLSERALSSQHSAFSQDQYQNQRPFTAKDAEDAKEEISSPRIDADERGLENPKPIVWKPTPDMYRMDTPEGREAYEASFGSKTKPRVAGEQRPIQPGIAREDRSETYASQHSAVSEKQNQHQRPFTAKDAEDAKEEQGVPRMHADDCGLENPKPIVWKPTPDMYRMDTPEGREAYEASFGTKTKPRLAGEERPIQPGIAREDRSEMYANLG